MEKIEVVKKEAEGLVSIAERFSILKKEDFDNGVKFLQKVKEVKTRWQEYWKPIKENAYRTWKQITIKEKEGFDICNQAEKIIKEKMLLFKKQEEEKMLQQKQQIEKELAEKGLDVVIPEQKIESRDIQTRKVWKARLVDFKKLVEFASKNDFAVSLLEFNQQKANEFARMTEGKAVIEGIEWYQEEILIIKKEK